MDCLEIWNTKTPNSYSTGFNLHGWYPAVLMNKRVAPEGRNCLMRLHLQPHLRFANLTFDTNRKENVEQIATENATIGSWVRNEMMKMGQSPWGVWPEKWHLQSDSGSFARGHSSKKMHRIQTQNADRNFGLQPPPNGVQRMCGISIFLVNPVAGKMTMTMPHRDCAAQVLKTKFHEAVGELQLEEICVFRRKLQTQ